jgi:hypothetical protein
MAVFWVVAPCSLVEVYQHYRGLYCLHHQGDEWIVEAVQTSETSVNSYQSTRRYNPQHNHLHNHPRREVQILLENNSDTQRKDLSIFVCYDVLKSSLASGYWNFKWTYHIQL